MEYGSNIFYLEKLGERLLVKGCRPPQLNYRFNWITSFNNSSDVVIVFELAWNAL